MIELDERLREYGPEGDTIRAAAAPISGRRDRRHLAGRGASQRRLSNAPDQSRARRRGRTGDSARSSSGSTKPIRRLAPTDEVHRKLADLLAARIAHALDLRWRLIETAQSDHFLAAGVLDDVMAGDDFCRVRHEFAAQRRRLRDDAALRAVDLVGGLHDPRTGRTARAAGSWCRASRFATPSGTSTRPEAPPRGAVRSSRRADRRAFRRASDASAPASSGSGSVGQGRCAASPADRPAGFAGGRQALAAQAQRAAAARAGGMVISTSPPSVGARTLAPSTAS